MKRTQLSLLFCSILALTGCDKIPLLNQSVKCNDDVVKKLVAENFTKQLNVSSNESIKDLIENENITIDTGKLRATLNQLVFNIQNVRTDNSDPNSNKEYCIAEFVVTMPQTMVTEANASRDMYGETNVSQEAILSDITLENSKAQKELKYIVQPTDDGKTVFVTLENADNLLYFVRNVALDSLTKTAREQAIELAQQEELKRQQEENMAQQEYQQVLLEEAKNKLDLANQNLNLVWNATTKEVRDQLLDDQRIWLKKRSLECQLNSVDYDNPDVQRLICEAEMTIQRTNELKNKIYYLS